MLFKKYYNRLHISNYWLHYKNIYAGTNFHFVCRNSKCNVKSSFCCFFFLPSLGLHFPGSRKETFTSLKASPENRFPLRSLFHMRALCMWAWISFCFAFLSAYKRNVSTFSLFFYFLLLLILPVFYGEHTSYLKIRGGSQPRKYSSYKRLRWRLRL